MLKPVTVLTLPEADRQELLRWRRSGNSARKLAFRAKLILELADSASISEVAKANQTPRKTVYKWRDRYCQLGIAGLHDSPRPGRPTVINDETREVVLRLTQEGRPQDGRPWTVRLMAEHVGITTWQVRQIWEKSKPQP